jgi:primosomal protein N' (replication factor Y)
MFYYFVWVRSSRYHGVGPLTYSSSSKLKVGSIVEVELQNKLVLGFASGSSDEPKFKTKPITRILDLPPIPLQLVKLSQWLMDYYPAPLGVITKQILPASLPEKLDIKSLELTKLKLSIDTLPKLTDEQALALGTMDVPDTYLVHGRTGTGKTRLYIEMALRAFENNKSAIILTPEISLTTQLSESFKAVFEQRVIIIHSKQTPAERRNAWLQCLSATEPVVVIGPRSSLFAPINNLGLIVLDEEHENAYKQEQSPHYVSARVAAYLASLTKASLILGSATPLVSDYYLAEQKKKPIIELNKLAQSDSYAAPEIILVDRKNHSLFNRSSYLSQVLINEIEVCLSNGEQALLYLNRRGTARLVMCQNCGWQAVCPNCDIPLTYHGDKHQMRCHSCGYHNTVPISCPSCNNPDVVFKTAGTKAITDEVQRIFPNARISRFDTDNTKSESFEQNYLQAKNGEIDILIGTQMLAKGLDLPKLSLVGILLADTSLYIPDFSAQEKTFALINQVIGRIGRGHIAGKAIIQTYHPDNKIINYAVTSNYKDFYKTELKERQEFLFPPFCYLLKLSARRSTIKAVEASATKLKTAIQDSGYRVRVEGPAPSFHERFQGKYQWQLIVKSLSRSELLRVIATLPPNWTYDIDPVDLL